MKKIIIIIPLIGMGLLGFAAPSAHADGPTIDVQASCEGGLTITTAGYPDGQTGFLSIGGEPPRQLVLNSVSHTDWPEFMTDRSYLIFPAPGDPAQVYSGDPECGEIEMPPAPVVDVSTTTTTDAASADQPVVEDDVAVLDAAMWAGVELSPPW